MVDVLNKVIMSATDASTQVGAPVAMHKRLAATFIANFSDAGVAGTVKLQASNDIPPSYPQAANFVPAVWVDVPGASATISAGASGCVVLNNICFGFIRAVFTPSTAGVGTVTVTMLAQAL